MRVTSVFEMITTRQDKKGQSTVPGRTLSYVKARDGSVEVAGPCESFFPGMQ